MLSLLLTATKIDLTHILLLFLRFLHDQFQFLVTALTAGHCTITTGHCTITALHCASTALHCAITAFHCATTAVHCATTAVHCAITAVHCAITAVHCAISAVHCSNWICTKGKGSNVPGTMDSSNFVNRTMRRKRITQRNVGMRATVRIPFCHIVNLILQRASAGGSGGSYIILDTAVHCN